MLEDVIAIILIILIIGAATFYIIKAKKRGQKCIGCPYSKSCSSSQNTGSHSCCSKGNSTPNCCCHNKKEE